MLCSPDTLQVLLDRFALYGLELSLGIHALQTVEVVSTGVKFLQQSGYCVMIKYTFNFCTTNVFGYFGGVMAHFKLVNHKILNKELVCYSVRFSNHTHSVKQYTTFQHTI